VKKIKIKIKTPSLTINLVKKMCSFLGCTLINRSFAIIPYVIIDVEEPSSQSPLSKVHVGENTYNIFTIM